MIGRLTVRAYGVLVRDNEVLVTEEVIRGRHVVKFPGGGLELGEGLADCVVREFSEELGLEVRVRGHLYTTDFFVASAFDPECQVIVVYYVVAPVNPAAVPAISDVARREGVHSFRWIPVAGMTGSELTFKTDQVAAAMVRARHAEGPLC